MDVQIDLGKPLLFNGAGTALFFIISSFSYSLLNKFGLPPLNISLLEISIAFIIGITTFYFIHHLVSIKKS